MKRKTFGLMCGASAFTVAISIAASVAFARNSVLFSKISETRGQVNTFVIDDETEYTDAGEGLVLATAISGSEHTLQTLFYGFEVDGDDLVLRANSPAFFENMDPMNRGFNSIHAEFTSDGSFDYSLMFLFSYHSMDIEGIAGGKYADMSRTGNLHAHSDANFTLDETFTSATTPGMEDARYALGLFVASRDIRLSELSLGTACLVEPPVISEEGVFADYSSDEKALMTSKLGEVLPFVGTGVYFFDSEDKFCGIFFDDSLGENFINALEDDMDFTVTSQHFPQDETETGLFALQKEVTSGGDTFIETLLIEFRMNGVITYKVEMSKELDWIGRYETWPTELFEESLSDEFADIINNDPLNEPTMEYQMMTYEEKGEIAIIMQIIDDTDSELSILQILRAYVEQISNDNPTYTVRNEEPGALPATEPFVYTSYEYEISDGVHTISVQYEQGEGLGIIFWEVNLVDTFPTAAINQYLGLESPESIIPYTGTGKFRVSNNHSVYVYYSDLTNMEAYCNTLELNGFVNRDSGSSKSRSYVQNAFGTYYIYVSWYDFENNGYFYIAFYEESQDDFKGTFSEALNTVYSDSLILNHVFPELSGNHKYRAQQYSSSYLKQGIYISDLGQAYLDLLLADAVYNNYFGCYVFLDEDDGSNYFALEAEIVSGGIRIHARTVSMSEIDILLDSVEANAKLLANYQNQFEYLRDSEPETYAAYMAALPELPNSNGEKVYYVDNYAPQAYFYGNDRETLAASFNSALLTKGFSFSRLQSMYHLGTYALKVNKASESNSYSTPYIRFYFDTSSRSFVDFVSHSEADLTDLETSYAAFPYTGDEAMFYRPSGTDKVIVDDNFNLAQFKANLIAAGFRSTRDYGTEFVYEKEDGVGLYQVSIYSYDSGSDYYFNSDSGFWRIEFSYDDSYYDTFANAIANIPTHGMPSTDILDNLPDFSSFGASFHVNSSWEKYLEIYYKSTYERSDIAAALLAAGYVYDNNRNYYVYFNSSDNFAITCYIDYAPSRSFHFDYVDLNYTTWPDYRENLADLYYIMHDYIPAIDETGAVFKGPEYHYHDSFDFRLDKSVDIEAYVSKLVNFGYELTYTSTGRWELTYRNSGENPFEINVWIYEYVESYYFQFRCNNILHPVVSTQDIAYSFAQTSYSDITLFENDFSFKMSYCSQYIYDTYAWISFSYDNNETDKAAVVAGLRADSSYTESYDGCFTKETSQYNVRIYIYDSYWEMYIDRKS